MVTEEQGCSYMPGEAANYVVRERIDPFARLAYFSAIGVGFAARAGFSATGVGLVRPESALPLERALVRLEST
jgi:hypothetical protein